MIATRPSEPTGTRRRLLQIAGGFLVAGAAPMSLSSGGALSADNGATLLVGGPDGGLVDQWASLIAPRLARALANSGQMTRMQTGGLDGVTAANQLANRTTPDGTTAALLPGAAAMAWLAGDPRAHFNTAQWVPMLACVRPALVAVRLPPSELRAGRTLRVAVGNAIGPELPAMLGLSLLGMDPQPVFGLDSGKAAAALAQGSVDAVLLRGAPLSDLLDGLPTDLQPLFALGAVNDRGEMIRDPLLPSVPLLQELLAEQRGAPPPGSLYTAYQAAATAAGLDLALVLPQMTPAAMVALWRQGSTQAAGAPELQAVAASFHSRLSGPPAAAGIIGAIAADTPALLDLRRYLSARLNWQPA
jgi:hypothetical protein